jgi:hypothetical protein
MPGTSCATLTLQVVIVAPLLDSTALAALWLGMKLPYVAEHLRLIMCGDGLKLESVQHA